MSTWRYYAERITTNTWLDRDLRLSDVSITWALSGPGTLTATVDAELAVALGIDEQLLIDEWSTAIYAEKDGLIRWGGIVRRSDAGENGKRNIEVVGFTGYPKGRVYEGEYTWVEADPFDIVRFIWNYVQSDPNGNIGMVVDPTESPQRFGRDPGPRPIQKKNESKADYQYRLFQWKAEHDQDAYALRWWETPDCGDEIDAIMEQTPADYLEHHTWADANKSSVNHRLELSYPLIGTRRLDLRFVEGENIWIPPVPERDGDEYGNHVTVLGAGEGRHMLIGKAGTVDGRLRRDKVFAAKNVKRLPRLRNLARVEMSRSRNMVYLDQITVADHPNAPIGSWNVGDEIRIQAFSGFQQLNDWYRITGYSVKPEESDQAVLEVSRL